MRKERGTGLRRRALGASAVAVATAALLASGCGSDDRRDRDDSAGQSGHGQTLTEWIACSRTMAFGDVVSVQESAEAGNVVLTFDVAEWLKPAQGQKRVTLDVVDPGTYDEQRRLEPGQRLLIAVPERSDQELGTLRGDAATLERRRVRAALDEARSTSCPSPWSESSG
ncbi:hypothetical protein [Streptomyces sp. NPDC093094]|uniref:hypothetical protein n=1 Tax=Streptomyces sp. NPDC093094 TaxID=3366026 RepID=UPI00382D1A19